MKPTEYQLFGPLEVAERDGAVNMREQAAKMARPYSSLLAEAIRTLPLPGDKPPTPPAPTCQATYTRRPGGKAITVQCGEYSIGLGYNWLCPDHYRETTTP